MERNSVLMFRNSAGRIVIIPRSRIRTLIEGFNNGTQSTWVISLDDGDVLFFYADRRSIAEQLKLSVDTLTELPDFNVNEYGHFPPKPENAEDSAINEVPEIEES